MQPYITEIQIIDEEVAELVATVSMEDMPVVRVELNNALFTEHSWMEFSKQVLSAIEMMNPETE